ncbi:6-phosphogluconolactonase [Granulicatella balaenopterae]|uniref:6-phosphogluconolactonase n=1 Tax=Granulicatella balaenopterae TaxID=137733 RepID=A0A1H9H6N4_9LACT|nr:lactonase family protein [Granulicatella balaenopterae]SEQ57992.1 6-phosphogluconolactonase [Granulicatella balaenopterae]
MKETFLLGTYTKRLSKGIYSIDLNTETKTLENLQCIAQTENPTYLTNDKNYLFAVTKNDTNGGLIVYQEEQDNYKKIATLFQETKVPCYIAYNPLNQSILTANYHDATTSLYHFNQEHITLLDRVKELASSVHPNQSQSHLHFANYTPNKKFIISCDLGGDHLLTFKLTNENHLALTHTYTSLPGAGPRHIVFHPHLNIAYLICELSATIEVLDFNSITGEFQRITSIAMFNSTEQAQKWASAIKLSQDGKFLYTSNRGTDVIVVFAINQATGNLTKIQTIATEGRTARDFTLNQDECFLIVGHQDSDNLSLFERNSNTGLLTLLEKDIFAPEVICLIHK